MREDTKICSYLCRLFQSAWLLGDVDDIIVLVRLYNDRLQSVSSKELCQLMSGKKAVALGMFLTMDAVDETFVGGKRDGHYPVFGKVHGT